MKKIKVLNLYAGIGGNRKGWSNNNIEVTAIENDFKIGLIYKDFFPEDNVIMADAHQYLLDHYEEFDFIWSSPPCPSHSQIRQNLGVKNKQVRPIYPEMNLYQEIIFLKHNFKGLWVVENVIPYYEPLIKAQKSGNHLFWSNFNIDDKKMETRNTRKGKMSDIESYKHFDISKYEGINKRTVLRNCVNPELAAHIFKMAFKEQQKTLHLMGD